jgi:heterodisulfide reductase subunit A
MPSSSRKPRNKVKKSTTVTSKAKQNKIKEIDRNPKGALVIGGGITGIQAALDLAESGIYTYLLERSPSIGGRMAQLDKTFPTNDCAMCILSPKLVAVARHPNIRLLTNSELNNVTGSAGNFKVTITKHPRFVDENKCVGCGDCATKCPKKVPNEFDLGLSSRKAISVPFPQAVPLVYSIDPENCIYLQKGKCGVCAKICQAGAIDYEQTPESIKLDIGAIIVSTGYDQYDPAALEELGYGLHQNVITGLEFERMLNASGPTLGKIIRKSDEKPPKNILFIQCVGSRDKHRAQEYCSRICCMYAIKEAMIAREHQPDLKDIKILNMEIRAYGKGFEEYYLRARSEGIDFIHGRPAEISENPKNGKLTVRVENVDDGTIQDINIDLVILSSAVIPGKTNKQLSEILDIDLDVHGFFLEWQDASEMSLGSGVYSSRPGIFLSGCAQGPKDIPDSVAQGSAAAALAGKYLRNFRIQRLVEPLPMGTPESEEELRIGVFVCRCGINIGGVLDVPELVKYSKTLPDVVFAGENLYTCSDDTQGLIQEMIKAHSLNRVIVASCTPRTHEPIFRDTCARAGLNPFLFEMANIRDQCSWVHMDEPKEGTEKAKDLLRMAVARAHFLKPLETFSMPITRSALVIGGGIAGMECALNLVDQGVETHLVESAPILGGRLNQLNQLAHITRDPQQLIAEKAKNLKHSGVKIYTNSTLVDIQGYVGNFKVKLEQESSANKSKSNKSNKKSTKTIDLTTGAIVLAIGSELYNPGVEKEYGYGKYPNVVTNLELEERLKSRKVGKKERNITFIQCVGARESHKKNGNLACSRYCCQTTLNQAVELQKAGANVSILHKGIRAFSKYAEELYYTASQEGVRFIEFPEGQIPEIIKNGAAIKVRDIGLNRDLLLPTDLIVLTLAMAPNEAETEKLQNWLKVPRSADGFFLELHPKLGPVETNTVGIYLCGCAQGPKDITDSLNQASGAAAKVAALLSNKELTVEPITACVDDRVCWGCGTCEELCPYGAVQIGETEAGIRLSRVNSALCKGCGVCASSCPSGAMSVRHYSNLQISSMIKAFGEVVE